MLHSTCVSWLLDYDLQDQSAQKRQTKEEPEERRVKLFLLTLSKQAPLRVNKTSHYTMTCFFLNFTQSEYDRTVFLSSQRWSPYKSSKCNKREITLILSKAILSVYIITQSACGGHFTLCFTIMTFTSSSERVGDNSPRARAIPHLAYHGSSVSLGTTRPRLSTTGGGTWKQKNLVDMDMSTIRTWSDVQPGPSCSKDGERYQLDKSLSRE